MFKEKKSLAELSVFGIQVKDGHNSTNGGHFHLPPLHSTAVCSSCFSQEGGLFYSLLAISLKHLEWTEQPET